MAGRGEAARRRARVVDSIEREVARIATSRKALNVLTTPTSETQHADRRVPACGKLSTIYQDLILILQSAKILKYFQNFPKYQNTFFNLK